MDALDYLGRKVRVGRGKKTWIVDDLARMLGRSTRATKRLLHRCGVEQPQRFDLATEARTEYWRTARRGGVAA